MKTDEAIEVLKANGIEKPDPALVAFLQENPDGRFEDLDAFLVEWNKAGTAVAENVNKDGERPN